jgi:hypothetical protein
VMNGYKCFSCGKRPSVGLSAYCEPCAKESDAFRAVVENSFRRVDCPACHAVVGAPRQTGSRVERPWSHTARGKASLRYDKAKARHARDAARQTEREEKEASRG